MGDPGRVKNIEHCLAESVQADPVADLVRPGAKPPSRQCGDRCVPGQVREYLVDGDATIGERVSRHGENLRVREEAEADQIGSRSWRHRHDQPPSL